MRQGERSMNHTQQDNNQLKCYKARRQSPKLLDHALAAAQLLTQMAQAVLRSKSEYASS
jgi:hypothetical protein